ncbi:MAG: aromatic ring-hydroxylating oxygenase subunit alpha [Candidatus Binataceae bacterium]
MKSRAGIDYDALVKTDRVHSRVYTDAEIFSDEMKRIFHREWVYVGHTGEAPNAGDFRLKRIGLQPIIMVRDQSGKLNLLLNRCRHRGATVCQESRGNARTFRCAYHGWTYRLNGALSGVPYPDAYDDSFHRAEMGLVKVPRVEEYRGFVFGSLSRAGVSLEEHLGRARECIDHFVDKSPQGELDLSVGRQAYRYAGNWKLQAENSLDGYHPPFVHQSFLAASSRDGESEASGAPPDGRTGDLGNGHVTLTQAVPVEQAGNVNFLLFPNLAIVGVQLRVVIPLKVDYTEVEILPTFLKGVPDEVNIARLREHESFFGPGGLGSPDDTEVFERIQAGYAATLEPWVLFARGMRRERRENGVLTGYIADEVPQRGMWRQWKQLMLMTQRAELPGGKSRSQVRSRNLSPLA